MFHNFLISPPITMKLIDHMNAAVPFYNILCNNTHTHPAPPRDTEKFSNFYVPFNHIN